MNPQDQNPIQPIETPAAIATPTKKIGRFEASFSLASESWNVMKQDKEIAWFPVLSAVSGLVAMVIMALLFFFFAFQGGLKPIGEEYTNVAYVGMFVYYLIMFFITNYFLAGLYTVVHARFNGKNLSVRAGLANANANIDKILIWSLISATVGVVLRIIADRFEFIGKIVSSLLGAAWGILTYFSLPSLIIGQKTVTESFKESAALIRKTWGEALIMNFGLGIFFTLVFFGYTALSIGMIILAPITEMIILVGILYIVFFVAFWIILATLNAIFTLALYEYASTGKVPKGFTPALIEGAVKGK
jgi:hypothetical protein